jgi:hypothetical protein
MMKHLSTARSFANMAAFFALVGCGTGRTEITGVSMVPGPNAPLVTPPTVSRTALTAGETLVVDCAPVHHDEAATAQDANSASYVTGSAILTPQAPVVAVEGNQITFAPERATTYVARCVMPKLAGVSQAGPTITVLPGAARSLRTILSRTAMQAGDKVTATCLGVDAFGNEVAPPPASHPTGQPVTFSIRGEHAPVGPDGLLQVNSALMGSADVRCQVDKWPHLAASEPVQTQISPSPLVSLAAVVPTAFAAAHQEVAVICEGTDSFGHVRPVGDARIQLLNEAREPTTEGVITDKHFYADRMGTYHVLCILPEGEHSANGAAHALTSAPVPVVIHAAAPHHWSVRLHRTGPCMTQNIRLPITWRVYDMFNNEVPDLDVALTTSPPTTIRRDRSGGFILAQEGAYGLALHVVGEGAEALPVWRENVVVDSTPPQIVITSPSRAAMVQDANDVQMLTGYVKAGCSKLTQFSINGVPQEQAIGQSEYAFAVPHRSRWGLNVVSATAKDTCGNVGALTQSYLYSRQFGPLATEAQVDGRVQHGMRALFTQQTWDDGDPNSMHDVATLMQAALSSSSLENRLPQKLGAFPADDGEGNLPTRRGLFGVFSGQANGIEITRDGPLRFEAPTIEYLYATEGGWDVSFALNHLAVPYQATVVANWGLAGSHRMFTTPGTLASRKVQVQAHISVSMTDGVPSAHIGPNDIKVVFAEGEPDINVRLPGNLSRFVGGRDERLSTWFLHLFPLRLTQTIEGRIREEMAEQMASFLGGLQLKHSLPLPAPFETTLQVHSGLDKIELHGPRGSGTGEFGLYAQITTGRPQLVTPRNAPFTMGEPQRGSIRRQSDGRMPLVVGRNQSFALAVHDDLLNQMLWALWQGGAFSHAGRTQELSDPNASGADTNLLDAANVEVFFMGPPVVMPGKQDGEVVIGVGDVWVHADLDTYKLFGAEPPETPSQMRAGFFFSATIRAHIDIDAGNGDLVVTPLGEPDLQLQVCEVRPAVMTESVHHWLRKVLNRTVPRMLSGTLRSFPMPQLAIGRIPGVPNDAVWVQDNGTLDRPAGGAEMLLRGTLRGARQTLQ